MMGKGNREERQKREGQQPQEKQQNREGWQLQEGCQTQQKQQKKRSAGTVWTLRGLLVSALFAAGFTACYGRFRERAEMPLTSGENLGCLYQNTYLLYRDLYNHVNGTQLDCLDLYLDTGEEWDWIKNSSAMEEYGRRYEVYMEASGNLEAPEEAERKTEEENSGPSSASLPRKDGEFSSREEYYRVSNELEAFRKIFNDLYDNLTVLNRYYGYVVTDHKTGVYLSNLSSDEIETLYQDSRFYLSFIFDGRGNVTIGDQLRADGNAEPQLRRTAYLQAREGFRTEDILPVTDWLCGEVKRPTDCTVTYVILKDGDPVGLNCRAYSIWTGESAEVEYFTISDYQDSVENLYYEAGIFNVLLLFLCGVFFIGFLMPGKKAGKPWMERGSVYGPWFEILLAVGCGAFALSWTVMRMTAYTACGEALERMGGMFKSTALLMLGNLAVLTLYFLIFWYLGVSARAVRQMGLREYARQRGFFLNRLKALGKRLRKAYEGALHIDLTRNANRRILKIVLVNALILCVISILWFVGLGVAVVYSLLLYLFLRKYVSGLQKRYGILLKAVDEMAEGNLNVSIEEDLGIFEPFKPRIIKIQNGFKKAVDEETRSQRMKGELITNVSHDLKTPLTAIITYVNLLKDPNLTQEQRAEYLDTLERKSMRLKVLIEDLFEVSKANSGNVTLKLMPVDLMNLVRQVCFEMKDKLDGTGLEMRMNLPEEKIILSLDSQKTYRVYENLFSNVAKYALPGTRVYVNGFQADQTVSVTIKNISAVELTVDPSELTERFVRGDQARNTEGSGLGLAIAKSFLELQGGRLEVEVDGDLFKVTTVFSR